METKEIDLNNIKVAIFDFDDTLAIHEDREYKRKRRESEDKLFGYYMDAYLNPEIFYEKIEICGMSEPIFKLINVLRKNGVKIYCVSGMKFSFHLKAKENFVHKHYGNDIKVISAGTQELKIKAAKIIRKINGCNLNEILFVDDIRENIINFNKDGINAVLPEEVNSLLENNIK